MSPSSSWESRKRVAAITGSWDASVAIAWLEARGFQLTPEFEWIAPDEQTQDEEYEVIRFLIEEWDFGGLKGRDV